MSTITASALQYVDSLIKQLPAQATVNELLAKLTGKNGRSIVLTSAALVLTTYYILIHRLELNKPKAFRAIPKLNGMKNIKLMIQNVPFMDRYNQVLKEVLEEKGIGRTSLAGNDIIFFATPELSRQMLSNTDVFLKPTTETFSHHTLLHKLFGPANLVFSNGDVWKRHRAIANPAFHRSWDTKVFGQCADVMSQQIDKDMAEHGDVDLSSMFQRLTLDALGLAGFGHDSEPKWSICGSLQ
jgi:cytochrome P450